MVSTLSVVVIMVLASSTILFFLYSMSTDSLVESQTREINKQIVLNYENYIDSIIETANYVQLASMNMDTEESYRELQKIYRLNTDIKKDVVSIFLFDLEGKRILGNELKPGREPSISSARWFTEALVKKEIFHFSFSEDQSISSDRDDMVISVSKMVDHHRGGRTLPGILLIELNFQVITDLAKQTNLGEGGHILILDDDDSQIYSSGSYEQNKNGESLRLAVERIFGGFRANIDSTAMYLNINTLTHTRWRIVTVGNADDIAKTKTGIIIILIIICLVSVAASSLISLFLSRGISRPLRRLESSMFQIESGNFDTKLEESGQKEIRHLARSFNSMIDQIQSLMERVVNEQREKRKTELRALQNQINPHFLYNTLDSIVWLAENERSEDVINTVVALARFFRISISKGETFIPVRDEIAHIKNYLTIQKIRYVHKFAYTFQIAPEILEFKVMKLILQPIVENAIYHGGGEETNQITIRGYRENFFLIFEIENTGYGITKEKIAEIRRILEGTVEKSSVGMRNVFQRLKIYYGDEADIEITSRLDEMTNIKLIIPLEAPQKNPEGLPPGEIK